MPKFHWSSLLCEILGNMCIVVVCKRGSVVEITVGHRSWPTRFSIWPNNLFLKFAEMITEWDYLDSEVWQTPRCDKLRSVTNSMCLTWWRKWKEKVVHWILSLQAIFYLLLNQDGRNQSTQCKRSYTCAIYYQLHKWAVNFDMPR